jgi:prophage regulatory protein
MKAEKLAASTCSTHDEVVADQTVCQDAAQSASAGRQAQAPAISSLLRVDGGDAMTTTERMIRELECRRMTGLCRTRRWQMERAGTFPRRRMISGRISGYLLSEVQEWILTRPVSDYRAPEAPMRARGIARRAAA